MNSTPHIVKKHVFTLFNLVNLILAAMVIFVGSPKNLLFLGVAIANTLIGIINDVRAKKIVDKLKLLSEKRPVIMKNGTATEVNAASVAKGDTLVLTLGDQIMFDSEVETGEIEVNEALLTGEQDNIVKKKGDKLVSGAFVVAGSATARVTHSTEDSYVMKLQHEASKVVTANSKLFTLMNNIVKYISYALIPVGGLLLWSRLNTETDTTTAVTSTVAALISMIPEGLILLTSSVLALATVRLGRAKVLVNDLYAIETLARVDTICLDKTGTLTTGKMAVHDILLPDGTVVDAKKASRVAEKRALRVLKSILSHQSSENATTSAIKAALAYGAKFEEIDGITEEIPFSSARKYSGIRAGRKEYLMGAVDFMTDNESVIRLVKAKVETYRMIAVVERSGADATGADAKLLCMVRLEDEIRKSAKGIIKYFYDNEIEVNVISGDDLETVCEIAEKVGVRKVSGVNLSDVKEPDYADLVQRHNIFTRVTPEQKKHLVAAMRAGGKTVAMTGDGVNDILAMKEADASLAIGEGSDAARRAAKFVLLDSGFEAVPRIIDEGRQSINNLERSTTLFLAKTVYASILAVMFVLLPLSYPFTPIEMSLLNFLCIGAPGVILALEKNTARPKDRFRYNITHYSIPVGVAVSVAMLALSIIAHFCNMTRPELTTYSFIVTFVIDVVLVYLISRPMNKLRLTLIVGVIAVAALALLIPFSRAFFEFIV